MAKVFVLYYSSYGHIELMANAIAEGIRKSGAEVDIKRVPETVPHSVASDAGFKLDQTAPIATVDELANYDGLVLGTGTRFGRVSSQMAAPSSAPMIPRATSMSQWAFEPAISWA